LHTSSVVFFLITVIDREEEKRLERGRKGRGGCPLIHSPAEVKKKKSRKGEGREREKEEKSPSFTHPENRVIKGEGPSFPPPLFKRGQGHDLFFPIST